MEVLVLGCLMVVLGVLWCRLLFDEMCWFLTVFFGICLWCHIMFDSVFLGFMVFLLLFMVVGRV